MVAGQLYSRIQLKVAGLLDAFWAPVYNRVDVGLTLTPVSADAGADITLLYPHSGQDISLHKSDLPHPLWPAPKQNSWSPFSLSGKDYVRVAGPGVYVGCAYRCKQPGEYIEDNFVYFVLVRTS